MNTTKRLTPVIPITDKRFKYVPAAETDIRKTFQRARAGLAMGGGRQ